MPLGCFPDAKAKVLVDCLERRLTLWKEGNIPAFGKEGQAIQSKLSSAPHEKQRECLAKTFSKLMKQGKVKAAMRLLSESEASVLSISEIVESSNGETRTVLEELKAKHPPK